MVLAVIEEIKKPAYHGWFFSACLEQNSGTNGAFNLCQFF